MKTKGENELSKFPSAEVLLSAIQKEYEFELSRKKDLETRAGIFLPLIIALCTFILSNFNARDLFQFNLEQADIVYTIVTVLIILTKFICLILALLYFIKVLIVYRYERIDLKEFTEELAEHEKDVIEMSLINIYRDIVEKNQTVNDKKAIYYTKGIYYLIGFVILMLGLFILSMNC